MSGHSKWSTIKHGKAVTDARRGKLFTKLTREIIVAARSGSDIDSNVKLRVAVQKARDANMPKDNVERAIKKGSGEDGSQLQMVEAFYEGYGPGGIAILLETLTDNKNRTSSAIRSTFTKSGGNMAESGSVMWQFSQKGIVIVDAQEDLAEEMALPAIDAGADDFETYDSTLEIFAAPSNLEEVRRALTGKSAEIRSSELAMIPQNTVMLDSKTAKQTLRLMDLLEDLDDVQKVYSNADFPDEALSEYGNESQ